MTPFRKWFYYPDPSIDGGSASAEKSATPTQTPAPTPAPTKTVKTPGVAKNDINFGAMLDLIVPSWASNTNITVAYATQADFAQKSADYNTNLKARIDIGAKRSQQTNILKNLDKKMNGGVKEVKSYIGSKYGVANAESYFNQFGIVFERKNWRLPVDRQKRVLSLSQMITAIDANGFGANAYGKTFWGDILKQYEPALAAVLDIEQKVSDKVKDKNALKKELNKIITSLRFILRGNYPDTYTQVYRTWGFLKENY